MTGSAEGNIRGEQSAAWRHLFGKPDGYLVRLRCWLLDHNWHRCYDACCDGSYAVWCLRCETVMYQVDESLHVDPAALDGFTVIE